MTRRPARVIAAALALGATLVVGAGPLAAASLPLSAIDPGSGERVAVEASGTATHVVLFATWCPPCVAELEDLSRLEVRWSDLGYRLVIVAVGARQDRARLNRFVESEGPPGLVLFDADGSLQKALATDELPAHFVFDGSGALVIERPELDAALEDAVESLARGRTRR